MKEYLVEDSDENSHSKEEGEFLSVMARNLKRLKTCQENEGNSSEKSRKMQNKNSSNSNNNNNQKKLSKVERLAVEEVKKNVLEYKERFIGYGQDRRIGISYMLRGLGLNLKADKLTKTYLQLLIQPQAFYNEEDGPWQEFINTLGLTREQIRYITMRKFTSHRVKAEIQSTQAHLKRIIKLMKTSQKYSHLFNLLTPVQMARLIVYVHNDPGCQDLLDDIWVEMLEEYNPVLDEEKDLENKDDIDRRHLKEVLEMVRLENARFIQKIFQSPHNPDVNRIASRVFDENVVIIDPNVKERLKGVAGALMYILHSQKAFFLNSSESITVQEKTYIMNGDTFRGQYILQGYYTGNLLAGNSAKQLVNVNVLVTLAFGEGSDRIREIVINPDHVGLIRQLNSGEPAAAKILSTTTLGNAVGVKIPAASPKTSKTEKTTPVQLQESEPSQEKEDKYRSTKKYNLINQVEKAFTTPNFDPDSLKHVLTLDCVFEDSSVGTVHPGRQACINYMASLHKALSQLEITNKVHFPVRDNTPNIVRTDWEISTVYGGKLSKNNLKPYTLTASLFFTFADDLISRVETTWNAETLIKGLGIAQ